VTDYTFTFKTESDLLAGG